jgi:hypothetical protein
VFCRSAAEVGDQIEERAGGLLLMNKAMAYYPIQLSAPRPLEVAAAFGYADAVLREDRKILDGLLAEGAVVEASPQQRSKVAPSQMPDAVFAEDQPLVVTTWPRDLGEASSTCPATGKIDGLADKPASGPS